MIPLGYMAKHVATRPEWLKASGVEEILSVSSCSSKDFADWINYWRHNGYWLFDSPSVILDLAQEHGLDLSDCRWFYYEGHETTYDDDARAWLSYTPDPSFGTTIETPVTPPANFRLPLLGHGGRFDIAIPVARGTG